MCCIILECASRINIPVGIFYVVVPIFKYSISYINSRNGYNIRLSRIILAPIAEPRAEERGLCAEFGIELFRPFFGLLNILWREFGYAFSSDWTELFYVGLRYCERGVCVKLLRESYIGQRVQNFQPVSFVAVFVCFCFYSNKKAPVFWTRAMETTGIEPVTPCMSSKYSNQLSYASVCRVGLL